VDRRGSTAGDFAGRGSVHFVRIIAAGEAVTRINRAGRQVASAAAEVRLEVAAHGQAGGNLLVFQGPLLLGTIDQTQVVDTGILLGGRAGAHEVRNRDRGQKTDDGDDDHDFNERKARLAICLSLHTYVSFLVWRERCKRRVILKLSVHILPFANHNRDISTRRATIKRFV